MKKALVEASIAERARFISSPVEACITCTDGFCALEDVEPMFKRMKDFGIEPSERVHPNKFWADARSAGLYDQDEDHKPCDCVT